MYRILQENLEKWRRSPKRKPLIIKGARQVGKTHLLKSWSKAAFIKTHYINFEKNKVVAQIFDRDFDIHRILNELSFNLNSAIDPSVDLLIFDEIQACPKAITALKYFNEDMPELAVVCAGSLFGVALSPESFPVGKVEFAYMYPMNFVEFLKAVDAKDTLNFLPKPSALTTLSDSVHNHLWDMLKLYYVTGGMPEVVAVLSDAISTQSHHLYKLLDEVRTIQRFLVSSYENDFAKHAGKINAMHLLALHRNIPSQLMSVHDESIRRFQFGDVVAKKKGFSEWERPIHWLKNAGLVYQIKIANQAHLPFEHYTKPNLFKLIPNDIGLLGCMLDITPSVLMTQDFGMAKGYFAEVYVAGEIMASCRSDREFKLYSWQEGQSEIEYIVASDFGAVPIEVKSGVRTKSRSLGQFIKSYSPKLAIRLSAKKLAWDSNRNLLNLPLPLAHWILELCQESMD